MKHINTFKIHHLQWELCTGGDLLANKSGPEVIKLFSCSTELSMQIFNAHKSKNIKKFSFFQTQISRECFFSCS